MFEDVHPCPPPSDTLTYTHIYTLVMATWENVWLQKSGLREETEKKK